MATLIALAAIGVIAAGIFAGVIAVVSVAIRREEHNLTLISGATDAVTWAGRWLNGGVCPRSAPHSSRRQDDGTRLTRPGFCGRAM